MRNNLLLLFFFCFSVIVKAQQSKPLSLEQAIHQAWENSNRSKLSQEKVITAQQQLNVTKNERYTDFTISGQAAYLTDPDLDLKIARESDNTGGSEDENQSAMPSPHYLL